MKTSIPRFLLLGVALATLALASACSQQSSNAQSEPVAPPVVSAPPAPPAPATPAPPPIPAVTVKPATIPSNIVPTSPLAQVVRLAQAGVDESIIMVYVTNSSRTFNLDSDRIIYLTDLGVPTEVVTAMMQRDQQLQQEFAAAQAAEAAQAAQPAPPAPPAQPDQTAPAPEPAVANTADTVTPPAPVTQAYFYDTLSPYGNWVAVNGYGNCWQPTVSVYNPTWQPYCNRGNWVYSDCGWYWNSDYAWGATFHYGRWFRGAGVGWCWSPDTVWAPSWVTWRYSNNYCGWAPLPPQTYCQPGVGLVYQGGGVGVGVGVGFGLGASSYTFVPTGDFYNPHPGRYRAAPSQVAQIYNSTTVINNLRVHGRGNNQIVINDGIPVQTVARSTQTPIRPVPVHQLDQGFAHGGSGQAMDRPSRVFNRPNWAGNDNSSGPSTMPARPAPAASTTWQNSSRSPVTGGNDHGRPGQSRYQSPVNNQIAQAGQGQSDRSPGQPQPARRNPYTSYTSAPQRPVTAGNYRVPGYAAPAPTSAANFDSGPQRARGGWQQPGIPRNYTRNSEPRQNYAAPAPVVAPPVNYSAAPQPQPRSYSPPRNEGRQNYNYAPAPAMSAPPPQRSAPSFASAPAYSPPPQSPGGGRGNQNWGSR